MSRIHPEDAEFARRQMEDGCRQMENYLRGLLDAKGRVAEEIHAIRKLGKSLRGGFALFRLGKNSSPEIQAIGRLLSGPRDAASRLGTWEKIGWNGSSETVAIGALLAQQTRAAARRPPPETVAWCIERVAAACKPLEKLPTETLPERLTLGLGKLEIRLRKRCKALDRCGVEDFHELRKAMKAYTGAAGFFPIGHVSLDPRLTTLAELLGDENDLATLAKWLKDHGFTAAFIPKLWREMERLQNRLRSEVMDEITLLPILKNR